MRNRRSSAGFTLIEILMATLLLSLGVAGLLAVQLVQVNATLRARQLSEATALAQQQIELLRALPAPGVEVLGAAQTIDARGCLVPSATPPCDQPIFGTMYSRSYRLTPLPAGYVQLEATVAWTDPQGQPHRITLTDAR